jgi:hypothetical protein
MKNLTEAGDSGITVPLTLLLTLSMFHAAPGHCSEELKAGFAKVDITPGESVQLAGYGKRKQGSSGIHDPLSMRVVAFENNNKKLVLVSTDNLGFYNGTFDYFQQAILEEFDLAPSELMLSAIHTHSAPQLELDGDPANVEYTKSLKPKFFQAIKTALTEMAVVSIGTGTGSSPVGVNRREVFFDDEENWKMWLGRNPEGVTDKEVLVLKVSDLDDNTKAVLFDYATHSTAMGMHNFEVSGDIHGIAEQFVEEYLQNDIIAPAFAGASGDIDPWYRILPEFHKKNGWIPEAVLLGTLLGEEVVHIVRKIKATESTGQIKTAFKSLSLPGKPEGEGKIPGDQPPTALNITVAKIGDIAFVGLGGEVFCEIGKAIKAGSPAKHTFIITHCNGAAGYVPTKQAYNEGGYEITTSPFAPVAAEMVTKEVLRMLHEL